MLVGDAAGNGTLGGTVNVGAGGTLGGSGTIFGPTTIAGTLSAGNSPGTLTFANDLTLNAASTSVFELNSPGSVGGAGASGNDLVVVNGDLALGGTLDAHVAAAGYYRLFNYGGTVSGTFSGGTVTGTGGFVPMAPNNPDIQYGIPNQVNLPVLATGQTMQFWDGSDSTGNGVVDGGAGTWSTAGTNWTGQPGQANINGTWGGSVGVFAGAAGGTVTVAGIQSFDTLQFSTNGYVVQDGALALGVAGGGTLNVDNGISTTIASTIGDGAGAILRKVGNGTLILSGTNTHTGGTSLLGGVLSVSADANLGAASGGLTFAGGTLATTASFASSRAITLDAAGRFDVASGTSLGLSGAIGGTGALLKQGEGALVLSGANSYGGNTAVAAGTLIGDAAAIRGDLGNAGTVIFEQAGNASFDGAIAGYGGTNGAMTKRGVGILTLAGTSSLNWTIEAGGLVSASDRFGGSAAIASGASLVFDQTNGGAYAGVLSGSGSLAKAGSGAVLLTGDSSAFAGSTTVMGGQLIVGQNGIGALGGSLTIQSGGLLGGTGNLGSTGSIVTIEAGAVHAPGNSIGVQHVLGDYVSHGTLRIEATPSAADKIVVAGSVDITGAALDLVLSPTAAASWNVFNGPFTIIEKQSAGAVVGTFVDPVTQNLLFLDALLDYAGGDGNDVTLELQRNDLAFASVGRTRNQSATGGAIDTLDNSQAVWRSIALTVDADIVRQSFDALSGEIHASAKSALIEDSRFVRNAIDDRLRAAFAAPGASQAPVLAYGPGDTPMVVAADHAGPVFWSYGFGAWGSIDSDGNAASLKRSTGGLLIGTDGLVGDWRVGLLAGYSHSRFDVENRFSSGSSDNYHLGLYGGTQWGNLAFRSGLAYTWNDLSTCRSVAIPGIADGLSVGYHAGTFQAFGELGYGIEAGAVRFEPFANLVHVSLHTNGFAENGGAAALSGRSATTDVSFTTLGLRAEHKLGLGTVDATVRGMLGWRHAFGDTTPTATQAFSAGDAFTIAGVPLARNSAVIEAGLDLELTPDATFGLSYIGQFASGARDHGFKANLAVRF
ncbi:autotransporter domain-containing protein [Mesorhizobium sp. KR1-2]|uniref:autotransporter outer membrane beta-barrel domain-containing protein n=1 Tax=Mesorhizobium sp. KR1-2 TaxID=3156609 RepID=UPI0032B49C33